jgi:two-component system, cell cycle sensor histidine kinase and response regulator CckA
MRLQEGDLIVPKYKTVLVADDEQIILTMVSRMLERMGYVVLTANTPNEAIRLFRESKNTIDLVITDVIMPEMNGRDLAEHFLALKPGIKCLYMSGYTADIITNQEALDESVYFIHKPFTKNELETKVQEALGDTLDDQGFCYVE